MKIAIDARWIFDKMSGVGIYTLELLRELSRIDHDHEVLVIYNNEALRARTSAQAGYLNNPRWHDIIFPAGIFTLRNQVQLGPWLRHQGIDLYHSTNWMIPLGPRHPDGPLHVTTIHDLIPLVLPDHAPRSRKARLMPLYRWMMRRIASTADGILTVSEWSRNDVLHHLKMPKRRHDRVFAIPNGVSPTFAPSTRPRQNDALFVGRFDPYKNATALVEAFALALPRLPTDARLVMIGPPDPRYPEAQQQASPLGDRVEWRAYISGEKLVEAYQSARMLVMPSRYEGFGLPVLEAMACGTPVICSDAASLPEVAGDAALLVPVNETIALADAIVTLFTNETLWNELHLKGIRRAAGYSWQKTAEQTLAAYTTLWNRRKTR